MIRSGVLIIFSRDLVGIGDEMVGKPMFIRLHVTLTTLLKPLVRCKRSKNNSDVLFLHAALLQDVPLQTKENRININSLISVFWYVMFLIQQYVYKIKNPNKMLMLL